MDVTQHDLTPQQVPVGDLTTHPRNPRRGDIPAIAASLKVHGQFKPIAVQASTGYVIAGNHTLLAATRLGWETISAVYLDVDDKTALQIMLADNRTSDLIAVGSGMTLAGILAGNTDTLILGVYVGADPRRRLNTWAPGWETRTTLISADTSYTKPAWHHLPDGTPLDPYYEAKAWPYVQPGDLFWIVGRRSEVY